MSNKIVIDQDKLASLIGYVHTLLDFIDVDDFEDEENGELVDGGYDIFVEPLLDLAYEKSNFDEGVIAKKYDIEMFKENLEDIYGVDVSEFTDTDLAEIYDDVMDSLASDDQYSEIYNDAVWKGLKGFEQKKEHISLISVISGAQARVAEKEGRTDEMNNFSRQATTEETCK